MNKLPLYFYLVISTEKKKETLFQFFFVYDLLLKISIEYYQLLYSLCIFYTNCVVPEKFVSFQ